MHAIRGIAVSPGIAFGRALTLSSTVDNVEYRTVAPDLVAAELVRLQHALESTCKDLDKLIEDTRTRLGDEPAKIFQFHRSILVDASLLKMMRGDIEREHVVAEYAASEALRKFAATLRAVEDEAFQSKAADVVDVERRLVSALMGASDERLKRLDGPVVVVAHELTPTQAAELHRLRVVAFATDGGGLTSHTSIFARALGIPAVTGCVNATDVIEEGDELIVDGDTGTVIVRPNDEARTHYSIEATRMAQRRKVLHDAAREEPVTRDGVRIELLGNIELAEEVPLIMENGGEGVGLYRTEYLYLTNARAPTEQEHFEAYTEALRHCAGRTLTIRTLDLGADKYTQEHLEEPERNPFLGLRSIRYCLSRPAMFKTQLRALLRASAHGPLKIMFPLVSSVMELRQAKMQLRDAAEELEEDGIPFQRDVQVGIMIEVPSAAIMARSFAGEADFFSIGTNDLIQYTVAVDRGNERVAHLYSPAHPAVLQLVKSVIKAAKHASIDVSLCGEMAGDPLFTLLLAGLGLRTFSMSPSQLPAIKKLVRGMDIGHCEWVARRVGSFESDRQVVNYLRDETRKIDPEALVGQLH
ncbi:MAG: phosphoenolpyruvate--protein phosphotransferase [Planctomycetota bacterium]|nr:phosphoenolpyruvate--protein phosphotransferase [Planctomycetota bacterium]MDA1105159.1 phosphoenolpyruvate--protein phosphotransferase [Planctomycetota bacterium]